MTRTALVTGGVTGIGAATSLALKAAGYRVVANYFGNPEDAEAFHKAHDIPVYAWNIADLDTCMSSVAAVEAVHGPVEVLVNNAGITRDTMLHKMTGDQWKAVIDVDLGGCFNMCRSVIEGMRARRFGRIVNISSMNGLCGQLGQTNYSAAKAGVLGFTKALALEGAAHGITVNAIAPGYTHTSMVEAMKPEMLEAMVAGIPVKRLAQPEEIARGVVFLASDEAGSITGETLNINGGKYLS